MSPHTQEVEAAVLGAVLVDQRALDWCGGLDEESFYVTKHRIIWRAVLKVRDRGLSVSLTTVADHLRDQGRLEAVGGAAYLAQLDLNLSSMQLVRDYVSILKDFQARRNLIEFSDKLRIEAETGDRTAAEVLEVAESGVIALSDGLIDRGFVELRHALETVQLDEASAPRSGLLTGWPELDLLTDGLQPGSLNILGARPGMGKTSFALDLSRFALSRGNSVAFFSLEMSTLELTLRVLSKETDIPFSRLRSNTLSDQERSRCVEAREAMARSRLFLCDDPSPTPAEIASRARRLHLEVGIDLIVLDYLQLMQAGGKHENRNLEIASISRRLKGLAKELSVPILALSQLSRLVERRGGSKRPTLPDLRDSGAVEQDADLVAFLFRPEVYGKPKPDEIGVADLIVAKHRHGPTGTISLAWVGDAMTYRSQDERAHGSI